MRAMQVNECRTCHKEFEVRVSNVKRGRGGFCSHYCATLKHGQSKNKTLEYRSWSGLKDRCLNANNRFYSNYGGRGIKVCDRWLGERGFQNFFSDLGSAPTRLHTIDRIDSDGNYEPSNCRWATRAEQAQNTRTAKLLTHDGKTLTLAEWGRVTGIGSHVFRGRIRKGWSAWEAVNIPPKMKRASYYKSVDGAS